jgi:hypothetical protein
MFIVPPVHVAASAPAPFHASAGSHDRAIHAPSTAPAMMPAAPAAAAASSLPPLRMTDGRSTPSKSRASATGRNGPVNHAYTAWLRGSHPSATAAIGSA